MSNFDKLIDFFESLDSEKQKSIEDSLESLEDMILSRKIEKLESMVRTIKSAHEANKSIKFSSPVEPLIEVAIDVLLKLSMVFRDETDILFPGSRNDEILFLEEELDSLSNAKQIRRNKFKTPLYFGPEPEISHDLNIMIKYLISLRDKLEAPFHEKFREEQVQDSCDGTIKWFRTAKVERSFLKMFRRKYFEEKSKENSLRRKNQRAALMRKRTERR